MRLTHIDLFSGIGGFALAARWAGIKTVQFVEIDPFCQKVLQKNFPGVPIHDDIKTLTYTEHNGSPSTNGEGTAVESQKQNGEDSIRELARGSSLQNGRPFLLTGGFPCQPFSCAGKRRGTDDDRHLWPHMLRVIQELRPRWVIAENVSGLVNIKNVVEQGGDADMEDEAIDGGDSGVSTSTLVSILTDLEESGYSVQVYIIPACAVGAPHRRDRVWIVARYVEDTFCGGDRGRGDGDKAGGKRTLQIERPDSHAPDSCGARSEAWLSGQDNGEEGGAGIPDNGGEERNGWEEPWAEVAARLCRVDARVPNRVDRLKSLGNAIVPQVASELMRAILEAEGGK